MEWRHIPGTFSEKLTLWKGRALDVIMHCLGMSKNTFTEGVNGTLDVLHRIESLGRSVASGTQLPLQSHTCSHALSHHVYFVRRPYLNVFGLLH